MMLKFLLLAALFAPAQSEKPVESGIIVGSAAPTGSVPVSEPMQIVLLSPQYVELWEGDLQKRLDAYWERYKSAFAQNREFFTEISRMAYMDSVQFVINRMRRDLREKSAAVIVHSSSEGRFEFKDVPFGDYTVIATGRVAGQAFILQESIALKSPIPQFIELKTRVP